MSATGADGVTGLSPRWQRWYAAMPLVLLACGTTIGLLTQDLVGDRLGGRPTLVALASVTGVWVWLWDLGPLRVRDGEPARGRAAYWVVRTVLAFALTLVNPFLGFFAFVGYMDAADVFEGRRRTGAIVATACVLAGTHVGGLPVTTPGQWAMFALLVVVNVAVAGTFVRFATASEELSSSRAETIAELQRVNGELSEALRRTERLAATVAAQEREAGVQQERQRLAGEIHDTIAQGLAGVVSQLRAAREVVDPAAARSHLDRAESLARESLVEARRSVHDLAPGPLSEHDLPDALDQLVTSWDHAHEATASLTLTGDVTPLHPEVEATLLRVVQEALANVARHAHAHRVGVTVTYADSEVLLDVRDDGVGFDPHHASSVSFGVRGMRQRVERIAGHLEVESAPGAGTALSVRLPAVGAAPEAAPLGGQV